MKMSGGWRVLSVGLVCTAMMGPTSYAARPKLPVPSTWELDQLRSDFGGGPKLQSDVFTVNEDLPKTLSLDFVMTDQAGQTVKASWSGPKDGKLLPLTGTTGISFGIDRDGNEQWAFADGTTRVGKLSMEKDKKTLLVRLVVTGKDGKQYTQVLMYNRTD
jgi:hypothetical protein